MSEDKDRRTKRKKSMRGLIADENRTENMSFEEKETKIDK